jgi:hypothetical protein
MTAKSTRIAALNDAYRRRLLGAPGIPGQTVMTRGIAALCDEARAAVLRSVATFDAFTPDNDPHHEHDCAVLSAAGHRVIFKFDYYEDATCAFGAENAGDPAASYRVLCIMLATEY